jgi:hypothetical protein
LGSQNIIRAEGVFGENVSFLSFSKPLPAQPVDATLSNQLISTNAYFEESICLADVAKP